MSSSVRRLGRAVPLAAAAAAVVVFAFVFLRREGDGDVTVAAGSVPTATVSADQVLPADVDETPSPEVAPTVATESTPAADSTPTTEPAPTTASTTEPTSPPAPTPTTALTPTTEPTPTVEPTPTPITELTPFPPIVTVVDFVCADPMQLVVDVVAIGAVSGFFEWTGGAFTDSAPLVPHATIADRWQATLDHPTGLTTNRVVVTSDDLSTSTALDDCSTFE